MNWQDLYEYGEVNGDRVFYTDKEHTTPFTGKMEYYFQEKLSEECDIVNGLREGWRREYYDGTGLLMSETQMKNNRAYGLHIEYYESGKVSSVSTIIGEVFIDSYDYDEYGNLVSKSVLSKENAIGINYKYLEDKIPDLRALYDLEKISAEIIAGNTAIVTQYEKHRNDK